MMTTEILRKLLVAGAAVAAISEAERQRAKARSGAQRSELSTQLRDEPSSSPQEQGGM